MIYTQSTNVYDSIKLLFTGNIPQGVNGNSIKKLLQD